MLNEEFLAFIWQYQQLPPALLQTTEGYAIKVLKTGIHNSNAGPDFIGARLLIDGIEWVGSIELHVKSSDWLLHQHQTDVTYESVILHVVWENDQTMLNGAGGMIPTLEVKDRVPIFLWDTYAHFMNNQQVIPCATVFGEAPSIYKSTMLDKVLFERMIRKSDEVLERLSDNKNDWEETTFQLLTKYYGGVTNSEACERLAKVLPWKVLRRQRDQLVHLEALLFGCAGLLPMQNVDEYGQLLIQEYTYLAHKHQLTDRMMYDQEWKFSRMRPAGFPTIRLAQLARLLYRREHLCAWLLETYSLSDLFTVFQENPSEYWCTHYNFSKTTAAKSGVMGRATVEGLILNVVIPLNIAYNRYYDKEEVVDDKINNWLENLTAEDNQIIRLWRSLDMKAKNAFDSQAFLEWYKYYCKAKKCLNCSVGNYILRTKHTV